MNERELLQEQLYNSLKLMINWTWMHQDQVRDCNSPNFKDIFSKRSWAKEFCTIRFQVPRQSGHTTMIEKLCGKLTPSGAISPNGIKPVVLFPSSNVLRQTNFKEGWPWVGTTNALDKFQGITPNMAICDISSLISNNSMDNVYKIFEVIAYNKPFIFLLIG